MAKPKGGNVVEVRADRRELQPAPDAAAEEYFPLDENIQRFMVERASGAADALVKVYRAGGGSIQSGRPGAPKMSIKDQYLYECSPEEFSEEQLQASYGEGIYRVRLYGTNSQGDYGLIINRKIEIGPAPRWKPAQAGSAEGSQLAGGVHVTVPGSEGGADIARAITAAMTPILQAMSQAMSQGQSRKAMLEELQLLAGIVRGNAPAAADPMTMFRAFAEFSRESTPPEGGATGMDVFLRLVDKFGPAFENALRGAQPASLPNPAPNAASGAPNPASPNAAPIAAVAPASIEEDAMLKLKMGLQFLVMQAAAGNDAETYADVVLDNVPEESLDGLLKMPDPVAHLASFEPSVAQHREWFGKLIEAVKAALVEDPENPGAPPRLI